MPKRSAPELPSRPSASARVCALGVDGTPPAPLLEDSDFIAPTFRLGVDQDDAPQTFAEFASDEDRNVATASRRTLVIVPLGMSLAEHALKPHSLAGLTLPPVAEVASYLAAFTGLPTRIVAELPIEKWTPTRGERGKAVAVRTRKSLIRVSVKKSDGEFAETLEVCDLLDALLEELPKDAFAIVGLTPFDICEGSVPVGGRAFGGSRIACISYARYHPALDDISRDWPLGVRAKAGGAITTAARAAAAALPTAGGSALWLERVCTQVASHEVGHCMGLDHCTYYNCYMGENEGQAPYACPVCLRKLFDTNGAARGAASTDAFLSAARAHYSALADFCCGPRLQVPKWAAMHAWCVGRLAQLEASGGGPTSAGRGAGTGAAIASSAATVGRERAQGSFPE